MEARLTSKCIRSIVRPLRENLKGWKRQWKLELIERENPAWTDLYDNLI